MPDPQEDKPSTAQRIWGAVKGAAQKVVDNPVESALVAVPSAAAGFNVGKRILGAAAEHEENKNAKQQATAGQQVGEATIGTKDQPLAPEGAGAGDQVGTDAANQAAPQGSGTTLSVSQSRGGWTPTEHTTGVETKQTEQVPEWYAALDAATRLKVDSAVQQAKADQDYQAGLLDLRQKKMATDQAMNDSMLQDMDDESKAKQRAIEDLRGLSQKVFEARPYRPSMREFVGNDPGRQALATLGAVLSGFGGAATGKPSEFMKNINQNIDNRVQGMQLEYAAAKDYQEAQNTAYGQLMKTFDDAQTRRDFIKAAYLTQLGDQMDTLAAQHGLDSNSPKLLAIKAGIADELTHSLEKVATQKLAQENLRERYAPPSSELNINGVPIGTYKKLMDMGLVPRGPYDLATRQLDLQAAEIGIKANAARGQAQKDQEELAVPGYGYARDKKSAEKARELAADYEDRMSRLKRAAELQKQTSSKVGAFGFGTKEYNEARELWVRDVEDLARDSKGPVTESDRAQARKEVPDATALHGDQGDKIVRAIKSLRRHRDNNMAQLVQGYSGGEQGMQNRKEEIGQAGANQTKGP